jgi:hypothetical protein
LTVVGVDWVELVVLGADVLGVEVLAGGELAGWLVLSLLELLPQPPTSTATASIAATRPARDFADIGFLLVSKPAATPVGLRCACRSAGTPSRPEGRPYAAQLDAVNCS